MRPPILTALLFAILIAVGCSRSGNFGAFLVTEVIRYGGHTITNASLRKLDARWTVKEDSNGFMAQVSGVPSRTVHTFMMETFGWPDTPDYFDGQTHRLWKAVDVGVTIQCIGRPGYVEIICLKGGTVPFSGGR